MVSEIMKQPKQHIRVAFMDFWTTDYECLPLLKFLRSLYDVELCDTGYDYAFYSVFGYRHLRIPSDVVSIFFTGENFCPDFNLCDYALGFDYLSFGDRYLRYPLFYFDSDIQAAEARHLNATQQTLAAKSGFCSFVVSNGNMADPIREKMFKRLSQYKQVDSGGRYMNNIGGPVDDKHAFEAQHKFCLVFENASHSGYTTEKIVDAFAAGAIPIYWGDPDITKVFNPKSFIWVTNEDAIEEAVNRIIYLDQHDEAYIAMLREPIFLHPKDSLEYKSQQLADFFRHIFDQPKELAYRFNRDTRPRIYRHELIAMSDALRYKHMSLLQQIKQSLFKK